MELEKIVSSDDRLNKLDIDLSAKLLLQVEGVEGFIKTLLVGAQPDAYLIVQTPRGDAVVKNKFFQGNSVVVRYLHEGSVFAFQSHILDSVDRPFPLTFLSFPKIVSRQELRSDPRADCYLQARVKIQDKEYEGAVLDISKGGCRFATRLPKNKGAAMGEVDQDIEVSFKLSDTDEAHAYPGVVRSRHQNANMLLLGVQFEEQEMEVMARLDLYARNLIEYYSLKDRSGHLK